MTSVESQHFHFITGRLAEHAVRYQVERVSKRMGFDYSISVLPITVAALMTPKWIKRHLSLPAQATKVIFPGHLKDDMAELSKEYATDKIDVDCGPRDIRDLAKHFGQKVSTESYGDYSIEILGEINHADQLEVEALLAVALRLQADGADIVDLGCTPGRTWDAVSEAVKTLRGEGVRVSIDSFNEVEVAAACAAGAELVLSVNSGNCSAALDWGAEVVAIPDTPDDMESLDKTVEYLSSQGVPLRIDPILEPLGCGFASSLQRYIDCRKKYPDATMMMGIGNITELTDVDSAGINVLLLGICEELGIQSILTTEVINWARTSVQECDLARRLVHHSNKHAIPPKHLEPRLVMLRDEAVHEFTEDQVDSIVSQIRDRNIRIFNQAGKIHMATAGFHESGDEPFELMQSLLDDSAGDSIDRTHAFYLGFELAKAMTANQLGKQYDQDRPLRWGFLTSEQKHLRLKREQAHRDQQ